MSSCDISVIVMEDVLEASFVDSFSVSVVEDEVRVGCVPGSGAGSYLIDHDSIFILDHDGNKIPI